MRNKKKIVILFAFILMAMATQNSHAQQQIAYIESEVIVPEMPAYKRAKSEVEAYSMQLQKVLEKKKAEMDAYIKAVTDSVRRGLMNPREQQEAEAKLQKMQVDLQKDIAEADNKLAKKEAELTQPIYEEFDKAVTKVAEENRYHYVLDKKILLYSAGGINATEKVKTALGISW